MSKETGVIVLGLWIILATQLGIPFHPWLSIMFAITGVVVATVGLLLRGEVLSRRVGRPSHDAFVEHIPAQEHPAVLEEKNRVQ